MAGKAEELHARWVREMQDILGEEKMRNIDLFRRYDTNNDGTVSRKEFAAALSNCGVQLTHDEIRTLTDYMDSDGRNGIDYHEFTSKLRYKHHKSHQNVIHHNKKTTTTTTTTTATASTASKSPGRSGGAKLKVQAQDDEESDWSAWEDDSATATPAKADGGMGKKPAAAGAAATASSRPARPGRSGPMSLGKKVQQTAPKQQPASKAAGGGIGSRDVVLDVGGEKHPSAGGSNTRSFHAPESPTKSAGGGLAGVCGPRELVAVVVALLWLYWLLTLPTAPQLPSSMLS